MSADANLESTACPFCEREDDVALFEKNGFRIVRCRACTLVYVNPRLTMPALTALYQGQVISPTDYYVRTEREDARSFTARVRLIERHRAVGTLLDLGCGPGTFSQAARARGWRTRGLDLNAASVERCRALGLDVVCGAFPNSAFGGATFDVVVMNDFLEHLTDPAGAIAAARELLAPDGILFVTTPNIGSIMARLTGARWLHLKPNEHLVYFDPRTIRAFLDRAGFRIEYLRSIGRVRNLAVAIDKLALVGDLPSRLARTLIPRVVAERVSLVVNPGDEMAIVARRA
jgi:SAM-dependent methyltransferase